MADDGEGMQEEEEACVTVGGRGRGGRGGRQSKGGRRHGPSKRSSRSASSPDSKERFGDATASTDEDPLTPPDRRLRAAGSSPMG